MNIPGVHLSRRKLLQAAGAAAAATYASSMVGTTPAQAAQPGDTGNELVTYPAPDGIAQNTSFKVKVRTPGRRWQTLSTYLAKVRITATSSTTFSCSPARSRRAVPVRTIRT